MSENSLNSKDSLEAAKWRYIKRTKEIKDLLTVLNLNLDSEPELRSTLRDCASKLLRNGVTNVDSLNILTTCATKMMEQTAELQFTTQLQLVKTDLENIMNNSLGISKQLQRDIRHHEIDKLSAQLVETENSETYKHVNNSNTDNDLESSPHKTILELKKEINLKKKEIEKIQESISEYEGLPPDIESARKILEAEKLKAELLQGEIESYQSFIDTSSSSFSP